MFTSFRPITLANVLKSISSKCPISTSLYSDLPVNRFTQRSHTCGQLSRHDIGKQVTLSGWVQYTRFNNKIIALRDSYGATQCVTTKKELVADLRKAALHNESVIQIRGTVRARPTGQENTNLSTGEVEVDIDQIELLSTANKNLPILGREEIEGRQAALINRLKHRYLDLRNPRMQHALRFRSEVCSILRNKLLQLNFVECETPTLFNRTPGGANEFIVPTQTPNHFYSLVQSPQQLKQLLMIGGLDRYFQICRCYRDEAGRSDRQPEFTQVDIELSFTNQELVMKLVDELIYTLLSHISSDTEFTKSLMKSFDHNKAIRRITYEEAFEHYGTDKPDMRFACPIETDESRQLYIKFPYKLNNIQEVLDGVRLGQPEHLRATIKCDNTADEYMIVNSIDSSYNSRKLLGLVRLAVASELERQGQRIYEKDFDILWIINFPLFIKDEQGNLQPNHHPFTAPTNGTIHLLDEDPLKVLAQHYDLVINGQEVAGGSIRIHDANLQKRIFNQFLKVDDNMFQYFIEALNSGCPPHGGIALGLDRLVAILMNKESIRDVIAFPKSINGRDLMTNSPEEVGLDVRRLYHLK